MVSSGLWCSSPQAFRPGLLKLCEKRGFQKDETNADHTCMKYNANELLEK